MRIFIIVFSFFFYVVLFFMGGFSTWENLSMSPFVYFFLDFLQHLGKKIVVLDLTIILAFVTCLLMPVLLYHVYTKR